MTNPLQIRYPVVTLDHRELLPAGTVLTTATMEEVIRSARRERFPRMHLMEYGTIAKDLLTFCEQPPYNRIFSNKLRSKAVFETMQQVKLVQPLLDIYGHLKTEAPYTYRHILIVFALSLLLGQELITDSHDQATVAAAASNHDFGKICIPMNIWKKSSRLTEPERLQLCHHAAAGYVLLSYYYQDQNHPAAITARDHHERCNASGYPRGIALQNRVVEIVAAVDIFDALISPRPYRASSYDLRAALDEVTNLAVSGAVSSDVVNVLISFNREGQSFSTNFTLSRERRVTPPTGNLYQGAGPCRPLPAEEAKVVS